MRQVGHGRMNRRSGFFHLDKMAFAKKREGVYVKSITGSMSQMTVTRLEPGMKTRHAHANEQIGYVLAGKVRLDIGAESQTLGPGDGYWIPPSIEHAFSVPWTSHLEYIEIFCPPKRENVTDVGS